MFEFLPKEIRDGLEVARQRKARRQVRHRVQIGAQVYPALRLWEGGFALDASQSPALRGNVDVFEGGRHILQGLIVASRVEGGELICEFKRHTLVSDRPALDYWLDPSLPAGFLPRPDAV